MGHSTGHQARARGGDGEGAALKRRRMSPNASATIAQAPTSESLQRRGSQNAGHVDHGDAGGLHAAAPGAGHPNPVSSWPLPEIACLIRIAVGCDFFPPALILPIHVFLRTATQARLLLGAAPARRLQRCRRSDRRCRVGGAAPLCPVSGESPGDTVHRSAPQVEHVHNGDGLHAERRRFRPQRAVPGACIRPRAAPDFEVREPAAYECYLQRRRPGDSSRAVFQAAGVEWVLRRRPCIRTAAAGASPVLLPQAGHYATCELGAINPFLELPAIDGIRPQLPHPGVLISSWH